MHRFATYVYSNTCASCTKTRVELSKFYYDNAKINYLGPIIQQFLVLLTSTPKLSLTNNKQFKILIVF